MSKVPITSFFVTYESTTFTVFYWSKRTPKMCLINTVCVYNIFCIQLIKKYKTHCEGPFNYQVAPNSNIEWKFVIIITTDIVTKNLFENLVVSNEVYFEH